MTGFHGEAARRRRPASTAASSCCRPRCLDLHRGRRQRAGKASRSTALAADGPADGVRAPRLLAADGHAARQEPARRTVGSRATRPGRSGNDASVQTRDFWRGRRVLRHRPHRLQGRLARALAAVGWAREVHGYRAGTRQPSPTSSTSRGVDELTDRTRRATFATLAAAQAPFMQGAARNRLPPRRAAAGARQLPRPAGHLRDQRHGHGERARRAARAGDQCAWSCSSPPTRSTRTANGPHPYREDDAARRARSLQRQQGRRGDRRRPAIASPSSTAQGVALATARAGNVIGGGDWADDRLIPDCVRALGPPVRRWSSARPEAVRPWQHVLEPLAGYLRLGRKTPGRDAGLGRRLELRPARRTRTRRSERSSTLARSVYGSGDVSWGEGEEGPHETGRLTLECAKAATLLDVRPRWDLETSVTRALQWYRRQADGEPARLLCEADIAAFGAAG